MRCRAPSWIIEGIIRILYSSEMMLLSLRYNIKRAGRKSKPESVKKNVANGKHLIRVVLYNPILDFIREIFFLRKK